MASTVCVGSDRDPDNSPSGTRIAELTNGFSNAIDGHARARKCRVSTCSTTDRERVSITELQTKFSSPTPRPKIATEIADHRWMTAASNIGLTSNVTGAVSTHVWCRVNGHGRENRYGNENAAQVARSEMVSHLSSVGGSCFFNR
jgi:hypothetical protein